MAAEAIIAADRHLRAGAENIHKAAAVLAGGKVHPQTARDLSKAMELLEQARQRERITPREVTFAL